MLQLGANLKERGHCSGLLYFTLPQSKTIY